MMKKVWKGYAIVDKKSGDIVRLPPQLLITLAMKGVCNKDTHELIKVKITRLNPRRKPARRKG